MGPEAIHIGVDIGQKHDPTAIVVAEVGRRATQRQPGPTTETYYRVQRLERLTLGTSYPDVAAYIVRLVSALERQGMTTIRPPLPRALYMDATGVGAPVVDIVKEAIWSNVTTKECQLFALTFTHGDKYDRGAGRLGKAYLVSRLQALLQQRCIDLPAGDPEIEAMVRELKDYEIRIESATANDTYGAFKVGTYDDLATALGLAVLDDPAAYGVSFVRGDW